MAGVSFPKLGLKTMFSIIQLMAKPEGQHGVQFPFANMGEGRLWKEENPDLFTLALRENRLTAQVRVC